MHPSNDFYGHRSILNEYADVADRRLPGVLQHGWTLATGMPDKKRMVSRLAGYAWSDRNMEQCKEAGLTTVEQIGAPFLYLRSLLGEQPLPASASTILYPYHSSEWDPLEGSHHDVISAVVERETNDVTACLYWLEFENPIIRRTYEAAGFRVICHGRREDPGFLRRQYDEMARHSRVITNRVCTAIFYGGALGREIDVYGQLFAWPGGIQAAVDAQIAEFPKLVDGGLDTTEARRLAERELGANALRTPDELRQLLGWDTDRPERTQHLAALTEHYGRSAVARVTDRLAGTRPT